MTETISLIDMKTGKSGRVVRIEGGHGVAGNLENMGIRPGTKIEKVNRQFMGGPVIVRAGNTQVAMGCGMAGKVMVELI